MINTDNDVKKAPVFRSEGAFRRKLDSYFAYCDEQKRIPNAAGFCVFCGIRREDYFALKSRYPLRFDIAQSLFIDGAVNHKVQNTGASLDYLLTQIDGIALGDTEETDIICGQDIGEDGA
ncbi:MAG: hypothetical protein WCQ72_04445 [Eubacteriales bacterium]